MNQSRLLPLMLMVAWSISCDCQDAAARPRGRQPRPSAELTKRDIPQDISPDLKVLIEATFSDDHEVLRRAIRELGQMGPSAAAAVPFLVRTWAANPSLSDFDSQIALNKIGDAAAAAMITKTKNSSVAARPELIRGLGWCDTWRIREGVLPYFDDPNPAMRHAAVASLYNCNDPRVIGPLIRRLSDSAVEVREEAIRHFNEWPTAAAFDPLSALLNDVDSEVRWEAVGAISRLKDPRLVPVLVDVLQKTFEVDRVRRRAAFYLSLSGDQRAVEPLLAVLNDPLCAASVRAMAAEGLAWLHAVRAIEPLVEVLKNRDEPTVLRASAAHALTDFKDPRAAEQLLEAAKTENDPALRFWGAMGAATISGGAVCDDRIVTALRDYSERRDGYDLYYARKQLVLRMIVEKGKTESIRSAAIAADPLWPRRYDSLWGR